jgi:protein-tyrosine phosphatase
MGGHDAAPDAAEILVVCTANQCRSPLAAAMLRAALEQRGVDRPVSSAGLVADQQPVTEQTSDVAQAFGLDLGEHESQRLETELVRDAALVIGMERRHVREAVVLDPAAWPRTFTLKELVRRGEATGKRASGEVLHNWLARVHEGRQRSALLGASLEDDVIDPTGSAFADHDATARELLDLVGRFVQLAWPEDTS